MYENKIREINSKIMGIKFMYGELLYIQVK